jgi:hypothetical protein
MTPRARRDRAAASLGFLAAVAAVWTAALLFTGGVLLRFGNLQVSSRNWRTPAVLTLLASALAWTTASGSQRKTFLEFVRRMSRMPLSRLPKWTAPLVVLAVAAWVALTGLIFGVKSVAGADMYGYVSQAHLWAAGNVRISQPWVESMRWPGAADALGPLGYRPLEDGVTLVPTFPPGLPLTMAAFELIGGRGAVFFVVPLLGAAAVWATYLMGARLSGKTIGVISALWLATSPAFLYQLLLPMTDVPVTAWWALCLALAVGCRRTDAFGAGLCAGLASITRMNLSPLILVAIAPLALALRSRHEERGVAWARLAWFVGGLLPGFVAIFVINASLYGSPFITGLGSARDHYDWQNVLPNLSTYPVWLLWTETPAVLLAAVAPLALRRSAAIFPTARVTVIVWLTFAAGVLASYLGFVPHDEWIWLRFLLPALPPILVLSVSTLCVWLGRTGAVAMLGVVLACYGTAFARSDGTFTLRHAEGKTLILCDYIATRLPERAVFITVHHSGSIRYYTSRLTVRYDLIAPDDLDDAVAELRRLGYHPYLALEPWELDEFRRKFSGRSSLGALDWPPLVELDHWTRPRIYDVDAALQPPDQRPPTQTIR